MKEQVVVVDAASPLAGRACLACNIAISPGQEALTCPRCRAPHHLSCWIERGGCSRRGCRQVVSASLLPPKQEEPVRASKTPAWVIWTVAAAVVFLGVGLYLNARANTIRRENTTLVMIPASDDESVWLQVAQRLNEAGEGKKIDLTVTPDADGGLLYQQKLVVMLAARDGPEIVVLPPERFEFFVANGALTPLDDLYRALLQAGFTLDAERLKAVTIDGVIYGIPHPVRPDVIVVPVAARNPGDGVKALERLAPELYKEFGGA